MAPRVDWSGRQPRRLARSFQAREPGPRFFRPFESRMSNKECRNLKEDFLDDRCLLLLACCCLDTFDKMPLLQISTFLVRYWIFCFRI